MSKKTTVERFDCVEMKRRIQEKIYEETREMKADEFLAYIHQQVQGSRFAAFFAAPAGTASALGRSVSPPAIAALQVGEAEVNYTTTTEQGKV